MAYSLSPRLFVENGPAQQAADAAAARPAVRFLPWRKLYSKRRFEAIEFALKAPANDLVDNFPVAL